MTWKITVRDGLKGLLGAVFLGFGRALGKTMAVTFVILKVDLRIMVLSPFQFTRHGPGGPDLAAGGMPA